MNKFNFIEKMHMLKDYAGASFETDLAQFCKDCGYTLLKDDKPVVEYDEDEYRTELEMLVGKQTFYLDQIDMKLDKLLNK